MYPARTEKEKDTLKTVQESGIEHIEHIVQHLNDYGIVDEVESFIIPVLEHWSIECDNYLKNYGYKGGRLKLAANFYKGIGNCGVLFDTNKYNELLRCPRKYMDKKAQEFLKNHPEYQ